MVTIDYQDGIRALLCTEGGLPRQGPGLDEVERFIAQPGNLLWLDVDLSEAKDLGLLRRQFGFHDLALEDATRPHQRPKIENFDGYIFLIFYAMGRRPWRTRRTGVEPERAKDLGGSDLEQTIIHPHQIAMFIGANYLVTVHRGAPAAVGEVADRWRDNIEKIDRSISTLVYSLLDTIVDGYFPEIDRVADQMEELEEQIFEFYDQRALEQIFTLKKSLLAMRRVAAPARDVLNVLIRRDVPLLGVESIVYFQDIYDHLVRVTDAIDTYRDLLSSALDAYLSISSNRLNEVMRTLTSWSIPLMAGSLLAGVWGMNFVYMPELDWRYGYLLALAAIGAAVVAITLIFRFKRWL